MSGSLVAGFDNTNDIINGSIAIHTIIFNQQVGSDIALGGGTWRDRGDDQGRLLRELMTLRTLF